MIRCPSVADWGPVPALRLADRPDGRKARSLAERCCEKECVKRFSEKTGSVKEGSKLGLQVWMTTTYPVSTTLKSVSRRKLHRDVNINLRSAWFLAHRLQVALMQEGGLFASPVEVAEAYTGGKRGNILTLKREGSLAVGS